MTERESTEGPWKLAQLAERTGCPARTIRYYIARGLLPPPRKAGRAASYGPEHAERIARIHDWQAEGRTLAEIGALLGGGGKSPEEGVAVPREAWWAYQVAPDAVVQVRADASPRRLRAVRRAVADLAARLAEAGEPEISSQTTEPTKPERNHR